mmetsp:Transcript_8461/g.12498  ORF Transcript_8461/g.12498 Transcript_8461/m.12498 type:complete len:193 (+) Transcript_8461:19-597(+)
MIEKTFAIIKPDSVRQGHEDAILARIVKEGFTIVAQRKLTLSADEAAIFYKEHEGKEFYQRLIQFMQSGPCVVLCLAKEDAIKSWRALLGPTEVETARKEAPSSIRGLYATSNTFNAAHGSDAVSSAAREIKLFFPSLILEPIDTDSDAFMQAQLDSVLVSGLTALAKERPDEPISWLSNWLLEHNPNKPKN